ncbi:MAG: hypothetical protein MSJ26_08215 [Oscillospiraceae bacterium]|nr:hypothetical protein [Oscillospiraceae bacterium]
MLSKPEYGWALFQLDGINAYDLSYLDDIASDWIDRSISGLENLCPFCVKGYLEPGRMVCTVSFCNCYIIVENDDCGYTDKADIVIDTAHMTMLDFCKKLYEDISSDVGGWAGFSSSSDEDISGKIKLLEEKLRHLKDLISEREEFFDDAHRFF